MYYSLSDVIATACGDVKVITFNCNTVRLYISDSTWILIYPAPFHASYSDSSSELKSEWSVENPSSLSIISLVRLATHLMTAVYVSSSRTLRRDRYHRETHVPTITLINFLSPTRIFTTDPGFLTPRLETTMFPSQNRLCVAARHWFGSEETESFEYHTS